MDILFYNWPKHIVTLQKDSTVVFPTPGTGGIPFVVQTYGSPQYLGAFWTAASSRIYFEPTINVESGLSNGGRSFRIEWVGSEDTDPRDTSTEMALREHLKLVDLVLPHPLKGYEIYSWDAGNENWRFTLIEGTNRNKSCDEITNNEYSTELANINLEDFLAVLSSVPEGENVVWWPSLTECPQIEMPDASTVKTIEQFCSFLRLELSLTSAE